MVAVCLTAVLVTGQSSGSAQGPPTLTPDLNSSSDYRKAPKGEFPDHGAQSLGDLVFEKTRIENVREGYQTIRWEPLERATRYDVVDVDGLQFYSGDQNEAFLSGLPDGEHAFTVHAFGNDGTLIGSSRTPVVIEVQHWPIEQAWALLALGAVVFVVMIGMIVVGATQAQSTERVS